MAKDFGKLNNKKIEAVAKKSNESANVITVKVEQCTILGGSFNYYI